MLADSHSFNGKVERCSKPFWILMKLELMNRSGDTDSGISWAIWPTQIICTAPQTVIPALHHSVFTGHVDILHADAEICEM